MALDPKMMFSPNLQEFFIDPATNLPLSGGFVTYYKDNSRSDLKTVYELTGSPGSYNFSPLPNPLELSGAGTTINEAGADTRVYYYPYDEDDGNIENYYIRVTDSVGNTKLTRQAWPNLSSTSDAATQYAYNFIRNGNFYNWNHNGATLIENVKTGSVNLTDFMFSDWTYEQDDDSQDIDIEQGTFTASDSSVPGNPIHYLKYLNNSAGSAVGTYNRFRQTYEGVKTLSGQNVAISIWVDQISGAAGEFSATVTQDFGSAGSTSVTTAIFTEPTLQIGQWTLYQGSQPLPSVAGKTIGTGNQLIVSLNMPLNQDCEIHMASARMNEGLQVTDSTEISNDDALKQTNALGLYPAWTTGDIKTTLKTAAPAGWLMMDDLTIGSPISNADHIGFSYFPLYDLIWTNVASNAYAQMYTSAGVPTNYGGSSMADWQAGNSLSLTKALGRALSGAAPLTVNDSFYYSYSGSGNNLVTLFTKTTNSIYTGDLIEFSVGAPTGITPNIPLYVIVINSTTIQVATTLANAVAGTAIPLSGTAAANVFFTSVLAAQAFASFNGEPKHAQLTAELAAHLHAAGTLTGTIETTDAGSGPSTTHVLADVRAISNSATATISGSTATTGSGTPFNITQPTVYYNVMIKL